MGKRPNFSMEQMPVNERRILYIELKDNPKVETVSVGEGNRRKVTVVPIRRQS